MLKQENYHLIGIGGIGMSGLAQILHEKNIQVSGSDISENDLIQKMKKTGIAIKIGHEKENIQANNTIVYSSAISPDNPEYVQALQIGCTVLHRSDLLCRLLEEKKSLLVTGTHGKTTTTALLASVLMRANEDPSYMVGGIMQEYLSNAHYGKGQYFVCESDESDGSFLKMQGLGAIVTNIDLDHLDYWKTQENLQKGFLAFFQNIASEDLLFWCQDDEILQEMNPKGISYGMSPSAKLHIYAVRQQEFTMQFSLQFQNKKYENISLSLLGEHNVLNAAAVFGMCLQLQIPEETIRESFANFQGVQRRLQHIGQAHVVDFFDDYGHHPLAIKKTVAALKKAIGERRLIVLFQPHRYTRTSLLLQAFSACLQDADEVFLTDIYAAHEEPIKNVSSEILAEKMKKNGMLSCQYFPKEQVVEKVLQFLRPHDVLVTIGAGDVTYLGKRIYSSYQNGPNKWKVALLFGGKSCEHEISILSAKYIHQCLDPDLYQVKIFYINRKGQWTRQEAIEENTEIVQETLSPKVFFDLNTCDVCMPIMHGPYGEDGLIQGFFEALDIAYTGCDYRSCVISMNKALVKALALAHGIATAPYIEIFLKEWQQNRSRYLQKVQQMNLPIFIKPVHLGSSVGIQYVEKPEHMEQAIDLAFSMDTHLVIEEKITGQEIEFSLLGTDDVRVAAPGEILAYGGFYDYEKKYGKNPMKTHIPADLSEEDMITGKKLAQKVFEICGCCGMARIDFFFDKEKKFWLNEINPIPGFTAISLYPQCFAYGEMEGKSLVDELIISAMYRKRKSKK